MGLIEQIVTNELKRLTTRQEGSLSRIIAIKEDLVHEEENLKKINSLIDECNFFLNGDSKDEN